MSKSKVGVKRSKIKVRPTMVEVRETLSDDMNNAIEITILHLDLHEEEREAGCGGVLFVSHGNHLIGATNELHLPALGGRVTIGYKCYLQLPALMDPAAIDSLISIPFYFSLSSRREGKRQGGKGKPDDVRSVDSLPKTAAPQNTVIGEGNLDPLPLILDGTGKREDTVVLEPSGYCDTLFFQRSNSELPRLLVRQTEVGGWSHSLLPPRSNVMWLTVESLWNPPERLLGFGPSTQLTAVFPLPLRQPELLSDSELSPVEELEKIVETALSEDGASICPAVLLTKFHQMQGMTKLDRTDGGGRLREPAASVSDDSDASTSTDNLALDAAKTKKKMDKSESRVKVATGGESTERKASSAGRFLDFTLLEFPKGIWKEEAELDLRKRWSTLATVQGAPSKHHSRVESDSSGLFSKVRVDLKSKMLAEREPRISWNMIRPFWMDEETEQNFIRTIYKYGVWPVELVVSGGEQLEKPESELRNSALSGKGPPGGQRKQPPQRPSSPLVVWLDLSPLLFPGNKSLRVAGLVEYFDAEEGQRRWGLQSLFRTKSLGGGVGQFPSSRESSKRTMRKDGPVPFQSSTESTQQEEVSPSRRRETGREELLSRYRNLQTDYFKLRQRYEKLKSIALSSKEAQDNLTISDIEFSDVECGGEWEEGGGTVGGGAAPSTAELAAAMRELLLTKEGFDAQALNENKKLLFKRYALASMRRKAEEEESTGRRVEGLTSERGPAFVVVEISLLQPLISKQPLSQLEAHLRYFLPDRSEEKSVPKRRFAEADLDSAVLKLANLITREFREYTSFEHRDRSTAVDGEKFYEHLERSMVHHQISETLRAVLSSFVSDSLPSPLVGSHLANFTNWDYIDWLYCRLLDGMQTVTNRYVIEADRSVHPELREGGLSRVSKREYFIFASEAAEELDFHKATTFLSQMLRGDGALDAQNWTDYAVIALRMSDYSKAIECLREAILLDIRYKEALLMYGVLLTIAGAYDAAELFLFAVVDFHPLFAEGWLTLHIFYWLIEKKMGAYPALIMASKCRELSMSEPYLPLQLAWDTSWLPKDSSAFLALAIHLLSFNLYELGEVCLAEDLDSVGVETEVFHYLLGVCHHLQGRYLESSSHLLKPLQAGICLETEPRLMLLLGHNKWHLGEKTEAVQIYQEAFSKGPLPPQSHMALLRCGYYFLERDKPDLAKQMFSVALREGILTGAPYGTPRLWLGLGLALFALGQFEDAEMALGEANTLDNRTAITWAYLGLICLHRDNLAGAQQCFLEAKRCGLEEPGIEEKIQRLSDIARRDMRHSRTSSSSF